MKRSGIKRKPDGRPLSRRAPLRRKTRIRAINEERAAKREAEDFGELAEHVRGLPCCACGQQAPSQAAHVLSRGAGGHAWRECPRCLGDAQEAAGGVCEECDGVGTVGNLAPLCAVCHALQHQHGMLTFCAEHGINLATVARDVGMGFRAWQWCDGVDL